MKKITFCVLILTSFAFSAPMSAKQLFNVQTIEVKKVNEGNFKDFYGKTAVNEENIKELVLRYDVFIEELFVNKSYAMVKKGDQVYVQAGGGIVADSVVEDEFQETLNKAGAVMEALRATTEVG